MVGIPAFAEAAERVVEQKRAGWRSAAHARNWFRTLEIHAFPRIGDMPVSEVTSGDVLEILTAIRHTKPPTARFVHMRVRAVLEWAVAMDWRTDNACDRLLHLLGPQHDVVTHRKALPHRDVAAAIEKVRTAELAEADVLAFEFMVLTGTPPKRCVTRSPRAVAVGGHRGHSPPPGPSGGHAECGHGGYAGSPALAAVDKPVRRTCGRSGPTRRIGPFDVLTRPRDAGLSFPCRRAPGGTLLATQASD